MNVFAQLQQLNDQQLFSGLAIPKIEPTAEQLALWGSFEAHAAKRCVRPFPASPALVADFLGTLPDDGLEPACEALQAIHNSVGASNPVASLAVRTILERRLRAECPRSWNKEDRLAFAAVPPEIRSILTKRENERDTALRRAQNQLAQERTKLPTTTEKENGTQ